MNLNRHAKETTSVTTRIALLAVAGFGVGLFSGCADHFEFEDASGDVKSRSTGQSYERTSETQEEGTYETSSDEEESSGSDSSVDSDEGSTEEPSGEEERAWIGVNQKLQWMKEDILSIETPAEREDIRYIDMANLSNSDISDAELETARQALSFALNSLSFGQKVVEPEPVDSAGTILRVDLDDYGWDHETWAEITELYPYAVSYDEDSLVFPRDERYAERLREETGAAIPYVQADWLISEGTQAPLYYDILELPSTVEEFEAQLGIDIDTNIDEDNVDRAGFSDSTLSEQNRVIERHELPNSRGALWVGYTFESETDERNIFANPLDFQEDGREYLFNLPNGMQAYYLSDEEGQRLDKAPQELVTDASRPDNAVQSGLSCMGCHNGDGIIPKDDEVREFADENLPAIERDEVLGVYPEASRLESLQSEDAERFEQARDAAGVDSDANVPVLRTVLRYESNMTPEDVAGVLGITTERLREELDASLGALPDEILPLRNSGGTIDRETFEGIEDEVVCAIGLGEPIDNDGQRLNCDEVL